ncbi:MAG: hypothetical protein M3154_00975 [Candidatus Eremiobacteraeota bacterium]|nr:hypothetical protein [Candidatus Eremiobacteraeota bacterium]
MRRISAAIVLAALVVASDLPRTGAAAPAAPPQGTTPPVMPERSTAAFRERDAALRAMQARFGKRFVQRFAIAGAMPAGWKAVRAQEAAAVKAGDDYQRRCTAGDPSTPARIDRVREPVAPGAVVQIAGDCFGTLAGTVTMTGAGLMPIRLTVQTWSSTAIAAMVPNIAQARHQMVVLAVVRPAGGAQHAADTVSGPVRGAAADAAARAAGATVTRTASNGSDPATLAKPTAPGRPNVFPTGSVATSALPSNEATVEYWPELERRTLGAEAIVNRTCAFPTCFNAGQDYTVWGSCPAPCADHEDQGRASGVNADGLHWLHEADDVWTVRHAAGWQVEQVNVLGDLGPLSIGPPQELGPERTLLKFHWQDVHATYQNQESGTWFFAKYWFTVTVVGPKGTWAN